MDNFAFQGLIGLSMAMYLWLISAGLTIIFGVLRIVNFAHGSLFMVGAYLPYAFYGQMGLPFWLAIILSLLGTGLLGLVMERIFLRRIYGIDEAYQLLLNFGFILVIAVGLAGAVGLWALFEKTWWGRTVRATASDREMANAIGINVPWVFSGVFAFGGLLAALWGPICTPG